MTISTKEQHRGARGLHEKPFNSRKEPDSMNIVDGALNRGAEYADLRHDVKRIYTLIRENRRTLSSEVQINAGFCVRALVDGSWGAGMVTEEKDLPSLLSEVVRSAKAGKRKIKAKVKEAPSESVKVEKKAKRRFIDEEKIDFLKGLEASALDQTDRISSLSVTLSSIERWVNITTSEARRIETRLDRIHLRVNVTCKEGTNIESRAKAWGAIGGMEYLFDREDSIREETARLAREADILVEAEHSPAAVIDCVLSNSLTGTLLHEAFGHAVEADLVTSNESILAGRIGDQVAAPCVNMRDDPTRELFGHYVYDHEGVRAQPTVLVEDGILRSFLHSRETAALLDAPLTGHCKAESYTYTPIVRQSNTILQPQDHALLELLDTKEGLFLGDSAGGQVNVGEGTFSFGTQYTREIENGELGRYLKGCSLSGNVLETMRNVDAIGKETQAVIGGCGKGQLDFQGRLMPNIRVREVMIGGRGR